jgi:hypothetical protein
MPVEKWRAQLRGAVYRGDGRAVVALARTGLRPDDRYGAAALQLIGDGLISALAEQIEDAPELAADCISALSERGWHGDTELVEHLQALLGTGPTPMLRSLPIDLEELAGILEGDPIHGGGRVDVRTGEVWSRAAIDYAQEIGEQTDDDEERWLSVVCKGSRQGYRDMEASSSPLPIPIGPTGCGSPFKAQERSADSKTCSGARPMSWSCGSPSPRNASAAGPERGSPTPATTHRHVRRLAPGPVD